MEVLKWIGIGFGVCCAAVFVLFALVASRMIFVGKFAELSLLTNKTLQVFGDDLTVTEIQHRQPPLQRNYEPGPGDVPAVEQMLLTAEGKLEQDQRYFDDDPRRPVQALAAIQNVESKVLIDRKIYARNGDELGPELADLSDGPFTGFRYVGSLNQDWFLVEGHPTGKTYGDTSLWQVSHNDYQATLLQENVYYTFQRPPKVFAPAGFPGVLVAIYVGDVSYGFGGYSSEPRYSILRAYTGSFPAGIDLVQLSLKAGVIVAVDWRDGRLKVTADPSRPTGDGGQRPPRIWSISLPASIVGAEQKVRDPNKVVTPA